MKTTDLAKCLTSFLTAELSSVRNVNPNTVVSYHNTFEQLLTSMKEQQEKAVHLTLKDITKETVISFLKDIESARGNIVDTRNQRLAAIYALFRYIQTQEPDAIF